MAELCCTFGLVTRTSSGNGPTLRELKKRRTHVDLVDSALELFTRRGFAGVTLDQLCDSVSVSKRTFFRYFTSKEDVALAPSQDLWRTFLEELEDIEFVGQPLFELSRDALIRAVDRTASREWSRQMLRSCQLAERTPSMNAHGLEFCQRITASASEILNRRFDLRPDHYVPLRLGGDMLTSTFRCALFNWTSRVSAAEVDVGLGPPTGQDLIQHFLEALVALPTSLQLLVPERQAEW